MDNMFYFFYKIIFRLNKEKDDIRNAYVYFNFIHKTVTSHNLEREPIILLISFSCSQRHENTLADQSKHTYYSNYFIKLKKQTYEIPKTLPLLLMVQRSTEYLQARAPRKNGPNGLQQMSALSHPQSVAMECRILQHCR